jgi:hypothetical protein
MTRCVLLIIIKYKKISRFVRNDAIRVVASLEMTRCVLLIRIKYKRISRFVRNDAMRVVAAIEMTRCVLVFVFQKVVYNFL